MKVKFVHVALVLLFAAWSLSFITAQWLQQDLSVSEALAARFAPVVFATGVLLAIRRPHIPRGAWGRLALMGLFGVPGYNFFFFLGLRSVPSGTASLVIALSPVFIAILARLVFGEAFGLRQMAGMALAMAGLFVVIRFGTTKPVDWPYVSGAIFLALAPLSWAFYTTIGRGLIDPGISAWDKNLVSLFLGSLPMLFLTTRHTVSVLLTDHRALSSALFLSLVCVIAGYAVWNWALTKLPSAEVAAFVFLNPPFANFWAWLIEGVPLKPPFLAGALVLLAGVALILFKRPVPAETIA
jgi:drug/metabolite transporter (DMT)-like permease